MNIFTLSGQVVLEFWWNKAAKALLSLLLLQNRIQLPHKMVITQSFCTFKYIASMSQIDKNIQHLLIFMHKNGEKKNLSVGLR